MVNGKLPVFVEPLRLEHCGHNRSWYGCRDLGKFQDSLRRSSALCIGDRCQSGTDAVGDGYVLVHQVFKKASSFAIAELKSPLGRILRRVRSVCGLFYLCDPCGHCYRRAQSP